MADNMGINKLSLHGEVIDLTGDSDKAVSEASSGCVSGAASEHGCEDTVDGISKQGITEPKTVRDFIIPMDLPEGEEGGLTQKEWLAKFVVPGPSMAGLDFNKGLSIDEIMQQGAPSVLRRRSSILKKQQEEERFKTGLEMSKMEFTFDAEKGVFCCNGNGNLILNERESSAIIPDEKHEDIKAFMAAVNSGDVGYAVGEITADEKKKITMVIKVNVREKREDVATIFFASSAEITENPSKKYTAFAKLDKPQAFDLNGECGCFAYTCTAHGKTFRVGQHVIRWTTKKTWARWENRVLDNLMGHPQKVVQNYGQPPIDFRGFI